MLHGRLDDISIDSGAVVAEIVDALRPGGYAQAQVLAASLRHPEHLKTAATLAARSPPSRRRSCARRSTPADDVRDLQVTEDWQSRPSFAEWLRALTSDAKVAGR